MQKAESGKAVLPVSGCEEADEQIDRQRNWVASEGRATEQRVRRQPQWAVAKEKVALSNEWQPPEAHIGRPS
eukprot:COSAG02_NODE_3963_length_5980_cov_16.337528_3_plen_72_part_00